MYQVHVIPKGSGSRFGFLKVVPEGFDVNKPVNVICGFHGVNQCGDGSAHALNALRTWPGWGAEAGPGYFAAVNKFNVVHLLVQTTKESGFSQGEIPFIVEVALSEFNVLGRLGAMGLSLGGGALLYMASSYFGQLCLVMPGYGKPLNNQQAFADMCKANEVRCLFIHAKNDPLTPYTVSKGYDDAVKAVGGNSELVLYADGGHGIEDRPFNAFYPWPMVNAGDYKVVPGSYVPSVSMYQFLSSTAQPDKLVFTSTLNVRQDVYRRPDGTEYIKSVIL